MFSLIRPFAEAHYVDRGCVHCPLRKRDVEVDLCAGCQWLTALHLEADPPFIRCRPEPARAGYGRIWV